MLGMMSVIYFVSNQPGNALNLPDIWSLDKILHAVAYGFLAYTVIIAFSPQFRQKSINTITLVTVCVCLTYGISDEVHQPFIDGRYASVYDVIADFLGSLLVALVWRKAQVRRRKNVQP